MSRRLISSGSPFESAYAYSRAVAQGDWCFVAGTTGYDYATMTMPDGALAQAEAAFATIDGALREAGFAMADIVRVQYHVADRAEVRPAATLIVAGLLSPDMKIEIEVTAYRGA